jgi:4-hydroxy-2-oxoheptanedioate aldolase
LVRTRSAQFADIGRPLDLGAQGVFVPNVRGADHVREVVAACRYAPVGTRSAGRLSGGSDEPLVMIVLETAEALDDLDAVLAVDGLDGVYVGPADLSLSLGKADPTERDHMQEVISSIITRAVAAGVPVGVHSPSGGVQAGRYAEQGATIVTAAVDTSALTESVRRQLAIVRPSPDGSSVEDSGPLTLRRIVPNLNVDDATTGHDFYEGFLGLRKQFDMGWVASFRSSTNPSVQVSLVSGDATAAEQSMLSVQVADVDAAYAEARRRGYEIVHPLTQEPWGVRRFFVRDPHGIVANIVGHPD